MQRISHAFTRVHTGGELLQRNRTFHSVNLPLSLRVKPFNGESLARGGEGEGEGEAWVLVELRLIKGKCHKMTRLGEGS